MPKISPSRHIRDQSRAGRLPRCVRAIYATLRKFSPSYMRTCPIMHHHGGITTPYAQATHTIASTSLPFAIFNPRGAAQPAARVLCAVCSEYDLARHRQLSEAVLARRRLRPSWYLPPRRGNAVRQALCARVAGALASVQAVQRRRTGPLPPNTTRRRAAFVHQGSRLCAV